MFIVEKLENVDKQEKKKKSSVVLLPRQINTVNLLTQGFSVCFLNFSLSVKEWGRASAAELSVPGKSQGSGIHLLRIQAGVHIHQH